jgi:hypothetical protein
MIGRSVLLHLVIAVALAGCGNSDSGDGGKAGATGGDGAQVSGLDKEARDAAVAEVQKHWVKGGEGWVTARTSGSPYAPDHYLRQMKDLTVRHVQPNEISETDKMNGFEWAGTVAFNRSPCREAGDAGMVLEGVADVRADRPRGKWSQWIDFQPESMHVQKVKGQWQIEQDTWLLRGNIPTAQDYAAAGVK